MCTAHCPTCFSPGLPETPVMKLSGGQGVLRDAQGSWAGLSSSHFVPANGSERVVFTLHSHRTVLLWCLRGPSMLFHFINLIFYCEVHTPILCLHYFHASPSNTACVPLLLHDLFFCLYHCYTRTDRQVHTHTHTPC